MTNPVESKVAWQSTPFTRNWAVRLAADVLPASTSDQAHEGGFGSGSGITEWCVTANARWEVSCQTSQGSACPPKALYPTSEVFIQQ